MKQETRQCQNCKSQFTIEPEDFVFYEKIKVPPPTFCPECRMIRRFRFWNERGLYKRKENVSGKEIFSGIPPQASLKVYERDYWWSDAWDPMEYGKEYDFSRPFFEQLHELVMAVPWPSRSVLRLTNSDYSNNASDLKNCYLCFNLDIAENSAYVVGGTTVTDSFDLYQARHTELSYDNYMSDESYKVFFSVNCEDCHEVWFSRNLIGCQNCFGCVNLRNKSYHIFNKPYTREAYKEYLAKFDLGSGTAISDLKEKAHEFWLKFPMRFTLAINNVNVSGEHIEHSKNVHASYGIHEAENLRYCQMLERVSDSYDYTSFGLGASLIYESLGIGHDCFSVQFSFICAPAVRDAEYSIYCFSSSDLFGCLSLRKKKYCIFNKQYSKDEYFKLREKIIAHMNEMPYTDKEGRAYKYGEFFPPEFSPFAYNETNAQDFFPLTEAEAEKKGYLWREPEAREYKTTLDARDLPDHIKDAPDSILKEVIECSECKHAYRIIEIELQFLRRIGLPLPRKCPECRFRDRFRFVNPPKLWPGKCDCEGRQSKSTVSNITYQNATKHFHGEGPCPNEFRTSYAPDRPEIIYCESCYNAEVV